MGAGDLVSITEGAQGLYRIDQMEQAGSITVEAVHVEPAVYQPSDEAEERVTPRSFAAPVPVFSVFLDLPLMSGQEVPHAPHLAVTAKPWPGGVAVYSSDQDAGYVLNRQITARAIVGETLSTLDRATHGIWDRGAPVRVRISGVALETVGVDQVLNGANLMAIGDGTPENWELFQFRCAMLVAPDTYDLSLRLRGQLGTDAVMPLSWPAGSIVVLMDGAPKQISLLSSERDLGRHYRIGPAKRAYDDPSYSHQIEAFPGIGLRPLSVCHPQARTNSLGDVDISWVRRTRIDGDSWSAYEVPLGELREIYAVRVLAGGAVRRSFTVGTPLCTYTAALRAADGLSGLPFDVEIAQISDAFGAGPYVRMSVQ